MREVGSFWDQEFLISYHVEIKVYPSRLLRALGSFSSGRSPAIRRVVAVLFSKNYSTHPLGITFTETKGYGRILPHILIFEVKGYGFGVF